MACTCLFSILSRRKWMVNLVTCVAAIVPTVVAIALPAAVVASLVAAVAPPTPVGQLNAHPLLLGPEEIHSRSASADPGATGSVARVTLATPSTLIASIAYNDRDISPPFCSTHSTRIEASNRLRRGLNNWGDHGDCVRVYP